MDLVSDLSLVLLSTQQTYGLKSSVSTCLNQNLNPELQSLGSSYASEVTLPLLLGSLLSRPVNREKSPGCAEFELLYQCQSTASVDAGIIKSFHRRIMRRPSPWGLGLKWTVVESGLQVWFTSAFSDSKLRPELRSCPSLVGRRLPASS